MKKTTLALTVLLGGFVMSAGAAVAAPMGPTSLQATSTVTEVRMTHHERRMMKKKMMRRHMMKRRMMNRM